LPNKFDFNTIDDFDKHISDSILGYDLLHTLITSLSSFFIKKDTTVVDLGCTSGKLLNNICTKYQCKGIGYDITSHNFIRNLPGNLELYEQDITKSDFVIPKSNIIYSIFTIQFIDINKRLDLLKRIYNSLNDNGAFIICEKEICSNGVIQEAFTFSNYDNKRKNFTEKEILNKEYDLRKIMNSLESNKNIDLFTQAGFKTIEPFFQSLNFKGYVCKK
jgi:tRNA (cmo5U34)-methyltransferase